MKTKISLIIGIAFIFVGMLGIIIVDTPNISFADSNYRNFVGHMGYMNEEMYEYMEKYMEENGYENSRGYMGKYMNEDMYEYMEKYMEENGYENSRGYMGKYMNEDMHEYMEKCMDENVYNHMNRYDDNKRYHNGLFNANH